MKKTVFNVVVPIYNEEDELSANIIKLHKYLDKNLKDTIWTITIADNASSDNSPEIGKNLERRFKRVKYLRIKQKGRGRAVKKAWSKSSGQAINMYMDIDLSTDLSNIRPLIKKIQDGAQIAIGSRLMPGSKVVGRPLKREIMSRGYNLIIKLLFNTGFSDAQCGFKAVSADTARELVPQIQDNEWFFDSELLIIAEKLGLKISEVPVLWVDNPGSTVRVMKTVKGDLLGLARLFTERPWIKLKK